MNIDKLFKGEDWSDCIQKMSIQHQGHTERTMRMGAVKRDKVPDMKEVPERKDELMLLEFVLVSETAWCSSTLSHLIFTRTK